MAERRQGQWLPLAWWPLAAGSAAALKWHFSVAAASELVWMLRPLSLLLQLLTGWHFRPNADGEWQSIDAGIVLVKACAGINFMVLSLLGWCWMLRPRAARLWPLLLAWPALLAAAAVFAWLTALAVNALRILAVVHLQPTLEHGWDPAQAHRLIGLLVYLPALSLQLVLADRQHWRGAVLLAAALYAGMMLVVPLLTGNAAGDMTSYLRHALTILALLLPVALIACSGGSRARE